MSIRQTASNATRAAIFRIAAGFYLALLALHPPEALQAQPLTLDNVLSRAIQHPDVAVAEAEINAAIGGKVAADRAVPTPTPGRAQRYDLSLITGDVVWTDSSGDLYRNRQELGRAQRWTIDRKSTRLNSSHRT